MVPGPIAAGAARLFGALSRARGARIFHPKGAGFEAELSVDRAHPEYAGVPLLSEAGRHAAVVRLSHALGLPDRWPDILGLALRLTDLHGPGRHQDLLLVTSAPGPLRFLFLPAPRDFYGHFYSTLLPYRLGDRLRMIGARPAGSASFELCLATLLGAWQPVADLRIGAQLDEEFVERLAFNPWHAGGGMRPVGPLMRLRKPAYTGSQRGRGTDPGIVGPWP